MTIQGTYRNTGLTPVDVLNARDPGIFRTFVVRPRPDGVHIMLYPKQCPNVKIQISRKAANIWSPSFEQLDEIEDLLNGILGDRSNPKPFKERDIMFNPGEVRKILDTPLGMVSTFMYYASAHFPSVIADAVTQYLKSTNYSHAHQTP